MDRPDPGGRADRGAGARTPRIPPDLPRVVETPVTGLSLQPFQPNSGTVVLPIEMAPASARRSTKGASSSGIRLAWMLEPAMVRTPLVKARSLMVVGTPCRGPSASPRITACSARRACSPAASAVQVQIALSFGFRASARSRTAAMTSTGEIAFALIRRTSSVAGV